MAVKFSSMRSAVSFSPRFTRHFTENKVLYIKCGLIWAWRNSSSASRFCFSSSFKSSNRLDIFLTISPDTSLIRDISDQLWISNLVLKSPSLTRLSFWHNRSIGRVKVRTTISMAILDKKMMKSVASMVSRCIFLSGTRRFSNGISSRYTKSYLGLSYLESRYFTPDFSTIE